MRTPLFYTIGEYTDIEKYCKRKGLKPHQTILKTLDGQPFPVVTQYCKGGYIYDVLGFEQCYSGYMVTLMRLPGLSALELWEVARASRSLDERAGAVGMLLKEHPETFEAFLSETCRKPVLSGRERRQLRRLASFILDFVCACNSHVQDREAILSLCRGLCQR